MSHEHAHGVDSSVRAVRQIFVAFTAEDSHALGNYWRITTRKTDFYLEPHRDGGLIHLSVHGPSQRHPDGHRFHVKVNRDAAAAAEARRTFVAHSIPTRGHAFDGRQGAPKAYLVARIRWLWDLQRARFRQAAYSGPPPEIADSRSGARLHRMLGPNDAADLDLVVSYGKPCRTGICH